jgi:hypothetical protein
MCMNCLRSLGSRDRGFEYHSGHGCLVFVCAFFCVYVQVKALRRADHPSKESYRLSLIKKLRKLSPMLQKREQAPKCGSNKEGKKYVYESFNTSEVRSALCYRVPAVLSGVTLHVRTLRSNRIDMACLRLNFK